eukprot:4381469-Heterocapsa_arctica.AAC.1
MPLHDKWLTAKAPGHGVEFRGEGKLFLLVWMDDICLFAMSAAALQHIVSQATEALRQHALQVQPDKRQWSTTLPDDQ